MMDSKKTFIIAWGACGIIVLLTVYGAATDLLSGAAQGGPGAISNLLISGFVPIVFGLVGALIVSRLPRNVIGWLLMTPAIVLTVSGLLSNVIQSVAVDPARPPLWFVWAVWFVGVDWVAFIFPIFFIALLFPTGSPPSPRWRLVVGYGIALVGSFLAVSFFSQEATLDIGRNGLSMTVQNPVGFIPEATLEWIFSGWWWVLALGALTVLSMVSLVVRYRRAVTVEREQIKWLLSASALFVVIYLPGLARGGDLTGVLGLVIGILLLVGVIGFPIAIGIAILRYHLYDIDIIIRRTLIYGGLTVTLGLVYFGGVVVLQEVFQLFTGQHQSPVATVISTLGIAALFTPLRRRIQNDIDRRFYRRKYDAQKMLERFAASARDEVELEQLSARLVAVVEETMQPERVSLWLIQTAGERLSTKPAPVQERTS